MWKQWELERGLTMMVSDDHIRKRIAARDEARSHCVDRSNRHCDKQDTREKAKNRKRHRSPKNSVGNGRTMGKTTVAPEDRWDHSGFYELEYGNHTYDQRKSDNQRAPWSSSESNQSISQPIKYGPRPPPCLHTNPQRERKRRRKRKQMQSPIPSSSTSSYQSDDIEHNLSSDSECSSSSSSEDGGRRPKCRRYGRSRREYRVYSGTKHRLEHRGETYGQCLKIRQAQNRRARRRKERRSTTYSSSSESENTSKSEASGSEDSSSTELSNSDESCSSVENDDQSVTRGDSHHRDRQRRQHSPIKSRHHSKRSRHKRKEKRRNRNKKKSHFQKHH